MKQKNETKLVLRYLRAFLRTVYALRPGKETVRNFFISLLLCGISFGYGAVPIAVCQLAACERKYISACSLGSILGYALFWGLGPSFELYAMLALVLCARGILSHSSKKHDLQIITLCAVAVLGFVFVIAERFTVPALLRWGIHMLCAACAGMIFQKAVEENCFWANLFILSGVVLGANRIHLPVGFSLSALLLAWAAQSSQGLCYCAAGTAALAVLWPQSALYAAVFCLTALIHRLFPTRQRLIQRLAVCGLYVLTGLRMEQYGFTLSAILGNMLEYFFPAEGVLPVPPQTKLIAHPVQQSLCNAAEAMEQAAQMLSKPVSIQKREIADIFDAAAAQVCQSCAKYQLCWQEKHQELYEDLSSSGSAILSAGSAQAKHFPSRFQYQCIHLDAFTTAVNDALENSRGRRRLRRRLEETRNAAKVQYETISLFLQKLSSQLYAAQRPINYRPEIAVQAAGRGGSVISGDRGAAFDGPDGTYYVILCDGMGTGSAAAQESTQAIEMLRQLLTAGMDAADALKALNGVYILRDNGCFSTVDLLRINLTSADAILYKWGAAPSYIKRQHGLRHLGSGSIPPGLSESEGMEQIHFSLEHGSVLVLLSDGLGGKESLRRLESCESLFPKDVAGSLFAGREEPEDDCTVVAVRLRPAAERELVMS